MTKRIFAMLLSLVMVFSICASGLEVIAWGAVSGEEIVAVESYTANLYFSNSEGTVTNYATPATVTITGTGDYTLSWDVHEGSEASSLGYLYIGIEDAWTAFAEAGYTIKNVKLTVDGTAVTVTEEKILQYEALLGENYDEHTDRYIVDLYSPFGGAAISADGFSCAENITVQFSVQKKPVEFNAKLCFYDGSTINSYTTAPTTEIDGPGDYTVSWTVPDSATTPITSISWLYVDIENIHSAFKYHGYEIEDVTLTVDNNEVTLNTDAIVTGQNAIVGYEANQAIVLYNTYGDSDSYVAAFDAADFSCSTNITVTFSIVDPNAKEYNAYMLYSNEYAVRDWLDDYNYNGSYVDEDSSTTGKALNNNYSIPSQTITGPGMYTFSWDMYEGYTNQDLGYLYIQIDDAWTDFKTAGYTVEDVVLLVDGAVFPLDYDPWVYESTVQDDAFVIEFYNLMGLSGGDDYAKPINPENFSCSENIAVTFSIVDPNAPKSYSAYMQYMNEEGATGSTEGVIGNWYLCGQTITGAGHYTFSWDMYEGYDAKSLGWLYIEIDNAYADFIAEGYYIDNLVLTVDGTNGEADADSRQYKLDTSQILTYEGREYAEGSTTVTVPTGDYIIELYNYLGLTGPFGDMNDTSVIDPDIVEFTCLDNITISFDIVDPNAKNAYLQYMNAGYTVGNYHLSAHTASGLGTYTYSWDMYDGYDSSSIQWLYIEIDDAYAEYTEAGYTVKNVHLYVDGVEIPLNEEYIWTYASVVEGETDDYIIELYNAGGFSGYSGLSAISAEDLENFYCAFNITVTFTIAPASDESDENVSVHTGKWVSAEGTSQYDDYKLTLEGWVTGTVQNLYAPSDIVMVLDQSASMYSPVGLKSYLWNYSLYEDTVDGLERYSTVTGTGDPVTGESLTGVLNMLADSSVDDTGLTFSQKLGQLGYFVAQSRTGGYAFCTTEEHLHVEGDCSICGLEEHVHSTSCGTAYTCTEGSRVVSFYNWLDGETTVSDPPYNKWSLTDANGLHLELEDAENGLLRVVAIGEGTPADLIVDGWTNNKNYYLTVTGYSEQDPLACLNVGDTIRVEGYAVGLTNEEDDEGIYGGSAANTNAYAYLETTSLYAKCRYVEWGYEENVDEYTDYNGVHQLSGPKDEYLWDSYSDTDTRLTDGEIGVYAVDGAWGNAKELVMWKSTDKASFQVNLSVDFDDYIYADTFTIHGACRSSGISAPSELKIRYYDTSLKNWVTLDSTEAVYEYDTYNYTMTVRLDAPVYANMICFAITSNGEYLAVDEVSVDLTNRFNVLSTEAGVSYTTSGTLYNYWKADNKDRFHDDTLRLIDGVKGTQDAYNAAYSAWEGNAEIIVDLGEEKMSNLYRLYAVKASGGISRPDAFRVYVSNDNKKWTEVGYTEDAVQMYYSGDNATYIMSVRAEKIQNARYVKFVTEGGANFTWIDEVEVCMTAADDKAKVTYLNYHGDTHQCGEDCYACGKLAHTHEGACGFQCSHDHADCTPVCTVEHLHSGICYDCQHVHDSSCGLFCVLNEHEHGGAECGEPTCSELAHRHYVDCVGGKDYGCPYNEHVHGENCYGNCGIVLHTHGEACGIDCGEVEHIHSAQNDSDCWTYDWFVCQYNIGDNQMVDVYVDSSGNVRFTDDCDDTIDMWRCIYSTTPAQDCNGTYSNDSTIPVGENCETVGVEYLGTDNFYFYKTQYGALYDAMRIFINDLAGSGLKHRISVVGFASELNRSDMAYTNGTGIYIDGRYYNMMDQNEVLYEELHSIAKEQEFLPESYSTEKQLTNDNGTSYTSTYTYYRDGYYTYTDSTGALSGQVQDAWAYFHLWEAILEDAANGDTVAKALANEVAQKVYAYQNQKIIGADNNAERYGSALMTMNTGADENGDGKDDGLENIMASVDAYQANYFYTNHYLGIYQAYQILEAYAEKGLDDDDINKDGESDRQKVVILFTDGMAQAQAMNNVSTLDMTYQEYTNDWVVKNARDMEGEALGATVYSICTSTVKATDLSAISYLYYATSDFSAENLVTYEKANGTVVDVNGIDTVEEGDDLGILSDTDFLSGLTHFMRVASAKNMADAFLSVVFQSVATSSALGVKASMQDIIALEFELPEALKAIITAAGGVCTTDATSENYNADAATIITDNLHIYSVAAMDGTKNTEDPEDDVFTFPENTTGLSFVSTEVGVEEITDDVIIEIGLRTDGRYYVKIDGFDYAGNFVSTNGRYVDPDGDGVTEEFWGKKLVAVIPIHRRANTVGGEHVWTNYDTNVVGGNSGILAYTFDVNTNVITGVVEGGDFEDPHVDIPTTITVKKIVEGDDKGFAFSGTYTGFAEFSLDEDGNGIANEEVAEGYELGGNYLIATGTEKTATDTLSNKGVMSIKGVLVGSTITISEAVDELYDVTIQVYDAEGNLVTEGVQVNTEKGEVTITGVTEGMTIVFTNTQKKGDLTLQKQGAMALDENQSFIFRVKGVSGIAEGTDMTVVVYGNGAVTIKDLWIGDYIVTEDSGWSWRYTVGSVTSQIGDAEANSVSAEVGDDGETTDEYKVTLTVNNLTVTFDNDRDDPYWMDGNAYAQNLFTGKKEDGTDSSGENSDGSA